jgi:hypothetical protein
LCIIVFKNCLLRQILTSSVLLKSKHSIGWSILIKFIVYHSLFSIQMFKSATIRSRKILHCIWVLSEYLNFFIVWREVLKLLGKVVSSCFFDKSFGWRWLRNCWIAFDWSLSWFQISTLSLNTHLNSAYFWAWDYMVMILIHNDHIALICRTFIF